MTVNELLNSIKQEEKYINGSLLLKSYDDNGCVYKYLILSPGLFGKRKEIFIELKPEESELDLLNKTVVSYIEIYPAK